ncbi:MAG TPA: translocation/assembly module TamB domain-containing protein [Vicinamibacterales bacterium]|nr:translocation/assembly module TamB domain-containing protein [Vicinamibacterales bacterium]
MNAATVRRWLLGAVLLVVALALAGWMALRTQWGRDRVRDMAIKRVAMAVDGVLTIDRLEGSLWSDATLRGVRITKNGEVVLAIDRVSVDYRIRGLIAGDITLSRLDADGVNATVEQNAKGWAVRGLATRESETSSPATVRLPSISVAHSRVQILPLEASRRELVDLSFDGSMSMLDGDVNVTTTQLAARETTGGLDIRKFTGTLNLDKDGTRFEDFTLTTPSSTASGTIQINNTTPRVTSGRVFSDGLHLKELSPYVKALDAYALIPSFDLTWNGPMKAVRVTGQMESAGSKVNTDMIANLVDGVAASGRAQFADLDLAPLTLDAGNKSRLTGETQFDIRLVEHKAYPFVGTFDAQLSQASMWGYRTGRSHARGRVNNTGFTANVTSNAYGAKAQADVEYTKATALFRAKGTAWGVDIRQMPAQAALPQLASSFDGTFSASVRKKEWTLDSTLSRGVIEGATIDKGAIVHMDSRAGLLTYHVIGRVSDLDTQRLAPIVMSQPGEYVLNTPIKITSVVDLSGSGRGSDIHNHNLEFSYSALQGVFDGAIVQNAQGKGTLQAGRLVMSVDGDVTGQWNRILLMPDADLRPSGHMKGDIVVNDVAGEAINFENTSFTGTLTFGPSSLFGSDVVEGTVTGGWADGTVTFNDAKMVSTGVVATMNGTLAMTGDGMSQLKFVMDAADLSTLSTLAGAELTGAGHAEGTVTGPVAAPLITGTAQATQLTYNTTKALGVTSTFAVTAPDWDVTKLKGDAKGEAVFVEVGGQTLQRVAITAGLDGATTSVDAVFEQPDRRVQLNAQLTVDAEDRDVLVQRASLAGAGETWSLSDGVPARIHKTGGRWTVTGLRLVNGTQELLIDGVLPVEGNAEGTDSLIVRAAAVSVEGLTKIAMGQPRITGRLDGEARIIGSLADPRVAGTFAITGGTADGVPFKSFGGSAEYRTGGATVDVKLDAGDMGALTAVGTVPLVAANAKDVATVPLNVRLAGSLTNAALLGPALPWIEGLSGTTDLNVVITGSVEKPLARGAVVLKEVGFQVSELGAAYHGLNASLRFEDTLLVVEKFVILDEDGHQMLVDGSLDVLQGGPSKALNLRARATQFHLMSNQYGELVVSSDLTVGGDLAAPNVLGTIRVEEGRVEVDRLMEEFMLARGYVAVGDVVTRPTTAQPAPGAAAAARPFADSAISIELELPDNVVVRGRGLQTTEGTIGLGDVNLTVGGLLTISKRPGGEVKLLGEVAAVRGTYDFQGQQFKIARDSILRFRGDDMTNPTLDITAEREISGIDVTVRIRGTAAAPELTLHSQPPLEEGDILSLVAFGRPISQLMDSQRTALAARAGAIAAGALAAPLANSVGRALDLDVFEIETGVGIAGGASVLVGRHLSDHLFVGFRHRFGNEGGPQLTLEYQLTEFLRIVSTLSPGGLADNRRTRTEGSGIDLIFVIKR